MLSHPTPVALRRLSRRLPQGNCWRYFFPPMPSKQPRRDFAEAVRHLTWRQVNELQEILSAFGNLGELSVNELAYSVKRHSTLNNAESHTRNAIPDPLGHSRLEEAKANVGALPFDKFDIVLELIRAWRIPEAEQLGGQAVA